MDLMLKKGKENRLNRFLRTKNTMRTFAANVAEKQKENSKPVVSTVSGLVDLDINESNSALDDKRQFVEKPEVVTNTTANSTLIKAVHEPINKINDLKSKSNGYESIFNAKEKTPNNQGSQNQDEQSYYKSSKLLKMFNNFIYAKEIRSSHDVFFDADDSSSPSNDGHRSKIDRLWKISSLSPSTNENKSDSNEDQKY